MLAFDVVRRPCSDSDSDSYGAFCRIIIIIITNTINCVNDYNTAVLSKKTNCIQGDFDLRKTADTRLRTRRQVAIDCYSCLIFISL